MQYKICLEHRVDLFEQRGMRGISEIKEKGIQNEGNKQLGKIDIN